MLIKLIKPTLMLGIILTIICEWFLIKLYLLDGNGLRLLLLYSLGVSLFAGSLTLLVVRRYEAKK